VAVVRVGTLAAVRFCLHILGLFQTLVPLQHKQGLEGAVQVDILAVMALPAGLEAVAVTLVLGAVPEVPVPLVLLEPLEIPVQPQPQ
jgi:hypothetical protein